MLKKIEYLYDGDPDETHLDRYHQYQNESFYREI